MFIFENMGWDGADWASGGKDYGLRQGGNYSPAAAIKAESSGTNPKVELFNTELVKNPREFVLLLEGLPEIICQLEYNDLVDLKPCLDAIEGNFAARGLSTQIYHNGKTYRDIHSILVHNIDLLNLRISELEKNNWVNAAANIYEKEAYGSIVHNEGLLQHMREARKAAEQEQNSIKGLVFQLEGFSGCKQTDLLRNKEKLLEIFHKLNNQIDSFKNDDLNTFYDLDILCRLLAKLIDELNAIKGKANTTIIIIKSLRPLKIKADEKYNEKARRGTSEQLSGHGYRGNGIKVSKVKLIS